MYIQVLLLNGFDKTFWYKVPLDLHAQVHEGSLVSVPLQQRKESALVVFVAQQLPPEITFKIREIVGLSTCPQDERYHQFLQKVSRFYFLKPLYFYQRMRHFLKEKDVAIKADSPSLDMVIGNPQLTVELTDEQQAIVDYLTPCISSPIYAPTLVHGVTGSGKTEVYKALIKAAIAQGKSVIMLLPEVTLALQFEHLLRQQLEHVRIIGFHSATKVTQKRALWDALVKAEPILIIGVHLPIMLPIKNLGLIIIDEEHELGFQEKKHPKLQSKEIAIWRAQHYNIPIILGSATPSLTSLQNVKRHNWKLFSITKRFAGTFPVVQKVILTLQGTRRRKAFWVSNELEKGITERLAKKEQIIIFLNRRGYSFFVQCRGCGFIFQCPDCAVSLTLHAIDDVQKLRCHYCDHSKDLPSACPECKAPARELLKKGIGTQQVVQIFQELFPQAVIARADLDSTSKKRAWQQTVDDFKAGRIDMLIGTQTITKGYHFPKVTLVGVLWADLNLHFPVYNAGETTLQQLIQVAGRAGRQCAGGKVIVQAMHDHPIFDYLDEQKYLEFCAQELQAREESFYPPYSRLASIELKHKSEEQIDADAQALVDLLQDFNDKNNLEVTILGPALPLVQRIQSYEIRTILLKASTFKALHALLAHAQQFACESDVFVVVS